ncbi:MAG: hypothetical protein Kow0088_09320 [Anaerolineales bacterium]
MDISVLILLAVILVAVAVLIGFLLATVLGGKSAEPPPLARQEGLDQRISFYTDRQMRRFILQIEGKTIEAPHRLQDKERRQLLLLDQALRKWLNLEPVATVNLSEENQENRNEGNSAAAAKSQNVSEGQKPVSSPKPQTLSSPFPETPFKKGVSDWLAEALQPRSSVNEPPQSIAMQVNEILQRKLQERGWSGRGIRLMELPQKGMVVLIGLEQYATVDEVPDLEIQAIIHAAVREWEIKMYGG